MLSEIAEVVRSEFSDVPNLAEAVRVALRLAVAAAVGAAIGYERELKGAAAGLRTHMLVALGSALFVLIPLLEGWDQAALSRVLQGLLAGIGFLGAGSIVKRAHDGEVEGVTTAASVWVTAALGVAAGLGRESTAVFGAIFALVILAVLRLVERGAQR